MVTSAEYLSATNAAKVLGCSRSSVCRAAKNYGIGIFTGGRLAAISKSDLNQIKDHLHESPGNPDWIAAKGQKSIKARKRKRPS
jgi:hypothetical protein